MKLSDQKYFARLYSDKRFREQEFQLEKFTKQEKEDISFFSQSLINKRRGVVAGMIQQKEIKELLSLYFQEYAEQTALKPGIHKHTWDNYLFLCYIEAKIQSFEKKNMLEEEIFLAVKKLPFHFILLKNHPKYYALMLTHAVKSSLFFSTTGL